MQDPDDTTPGPSQAMGSGWNRYIPGLKHVIFIVDYFNNFWFMEVVKYIKGNAMKPIMI